jgi:hypothetical protein
MSVSTRHDDEVRGWQRISRRARDSRVLDVKGLVRAGEIELEIAASQVAKADAQDLQVLVGQGGGSGGVGSHFDDGQKVVTMKDEDEVLMQSYDAKRRRCVERANVVEVVGRGKGES